MPLTGELESLGEDMLYSINLALHDIGSPKIRICQKDSRSDKEKIILACEEFRQQGIKTIGPTDSQFKELNNFQDLTFISLSNMTQKSKIIL